jgi:hypothetical protein
MSTHKIGSSVNIKVSNSNGRRKVLPKESEDSSEVKSFEIIAKYFLHKEMSPYYMVLIDTDMVGWTVSSSHVMYYDIDPKFLGSKFYDVTEEFII